MIETWQTFNENLMSSHAYHNLISMLKTEFRMRVLNQSVTAQGQEVYGSIGSLNLEIRSRRFGDEVYISVHFRDGKNEIGRYSLGRGRAAIAQGFEFIAHVVKTYLNFQNRSTIDFDELQIPFAKIKEYINKGFQIRLVVFESTNDAGKNWIGLEFKRPNFGKYTLAYDHTTTGLMVFSASKETEIDPLNFFEFLDQQQQTQTSNSYENLTQLPEYKTLLSYGLRDVSTERQKKGGNLQFEDVRNPGIFYAIAKTGYVRRGAPGGRFNAGETSFSPIAPKKAGASMAELMQILIDYLQRKKEAIIKKKLGSKQFADIQKDPEQYKNVQTFGGFGFFDE